MKIKHKATVKNFDGTIDIDIIVINNQSFKNYSFHLTSEYAARKFHALYRKGYHGKALTTLNNFKIKEPKHESIRN